MTGEAYIVHQGIFLGDEKAINRVYPEAVRAALAKICALKETVYTKAAVLDAPERFADTAYIFSTWGISAFSSRRICPRSRAGRCMRSRSSPRLQRCRMQESLGENSFSALRIEFSLEKLQIFTYNISERFMCGVCRVEIYSKGV